MNKTIIQTIIRSTVIIASLCLPGFAQTQPGDTSSAAESRFLAAREAAKRGDREALDNLAYQAKGGHPLDSYIRYWSLSAHLAKASAMPSEKALNKFLQDEAGTLLAERLRADWLRRMAKEGDWSYFRQIYPSLQNPDNELRCQAWNARLATGDRSVLDEIAKNWSSMTTVHAACSPVLRAALNQGKVSAQDAWQLFRRRVDTRSPARARVVLGWIAPQSMKTFEQAVRNPKRMLDRPPPKLTQTRAGREMALAAITRLARTDISAAYIRFQRISSRFTPEERAHAWGVLALHAAQNHHPEAASWFRTAGDIPMSATQRAWRVRASLRTRSWPGVLAAIDKLNAEERALPEWIYWRGRALKSLNRASEAEKEFQRIASVANFYGILANEELGHPFDPHTAHTAPAASTVKLAAEMAAEGAAEEVVEGDSADAESDSEESAQEDNGKAIQAEADAEALPASAAPTTDDGPSVDNHPGFQRAITLFRLDLRIEAIREWNWALRGRNEAFRLAAAQLALKNNLYDRAITSAELANPAGAWELRFLMPYREIIEPRARANRLDLSWVYGIMRQESRFIIPARSSAGAQGLMQVMPNTGKWVARQLGIPYHPDLLRDPHTNVDIGTAYMRIILDELGGDKVMAAAGYNAGPGRARRWRANESLEGAIYAETIPFEETRDYVKHVMTNTAIYAALIEGKPQSLKARIGTVLPKMSH